MNSALYTLLVWFAVGGTIGAVISAGYLFGRALSRRKRRHP